ncbi:hypothetical protein GL218_02486 [Daldinia childiae]|uniref:uncharacterized protein n=1 Tax=Daldinia childiae TaxID=326645 RepID=UPI0014450463|nr:uncharacterized protein GL218_02486 [Daldinia childiae]KAF3063759.1 hypothetical protein GL218_02486 [Daldinia childiae]
MKFASIFGVSAALIGSALGTTKIPGSWFHDDDGFGKGHKAAMAAVPMFHFGRPHGANPCYPESAQINGNQVDGNDPDSGNWSNLGRGCADPGPWINPKSGGPGQGNPFPVYYTINQCKDHEFRVTYSIYFKHDSGHKSDWEVVSVVWQGDSNNMWTRSQLMLGQHGGYVTRNWGDIQNTFNDSGDKSTNGAKNRDHAKVYVGAFYHAIFDTRKTSIDTADPADKQAEFRSNDWFIWPWDSLVQSGSLIHSDWVWGKADTNPPTLSNSNKGQYICKH